MEIQASFQLPANTLAYTRNSFSLCGLPFFGKLPIETEAIPGIG